MKRAPRIARRPSPALPNEVAPNEAHAYLAQICNEGLNRRHAVELACHRAIQRFFHPDPLTKSLRDLGRTAGAAVKEALDAAKASAEETVPPDTGDLR